MTFAKGYKKDMYRAKKAARTANGGKVAVYVTHLEDTDNKLKKLEKDNSELKTENHLLKRHNAHQFEGTVSVINQVTTPPAYIKETENAKRIREYMNIHQICQATMGTLSAEIPSHFNMARRLFESQYENPALGMTFLGYFVQAQQKRVHFNLPIDVGLGGITLEDNHGPN